MKNSLKLASFALIAFATAASANNCAPREQIVKKLETKYGETQQQIYLDETTGLLSELFANGEDGTWSILKSNANGFSCFIEVGSGLFLASEPARLKI